MKSSSFLDLGVTARTTPGDRLSIGPSGAARHCRSSARWVVRFSDVQRVIDHLDRVAPSGTAERRKSDRRSHERNLAGQRRERGRARAPLERSRNANPILGTLGSRVAALYGVDAQLFRLQGALDDVARNIPEDDETKALVARVAVVRNGHERFEKLLEKRETLTAVRRILRGWQTEMGDAYLVSLVRAVFGVLLALSALRELDELRAGPYFGDVYHLPLLPEAMVRIAASSLRSPWRSSFSRCSWRLGDSLALCFW